MGSCISKCKPRKKFKKEYCIDHQDFSQHVQDKLVISQAPISSAIHHVPVSPSSAASTTSFSSVSGGNSCNTSTEVSLSSSSSCSSSVSISKDCRSFSNEFLWACAKENPQIIGRNVIKGSLDQKYSGMSTKVHLDKFDYPVVQQKQGLVPMKKEIQDIHGCLSTPKKRARANSPTLVRQKSFRKEPEKVNFSNAYHLPNRTLMRSPSPSRRFNGESLRDLSMSTTKEIYSRRSAIPKTNVHNSLSCSSLRRENFRTPPSPNYDLSKSSTMLKTRDALIAQQIGPRNGKIGVEELANQDFEAMIVEDIHNPHIALDCFIFL